MSILSVLGGLWALTAAEVRHQLQPANWRPRCPYRWPPTTRVSNSQAGDALLCCLWGSRWPLPASSSLLEADSVQRPQPVPYRIFVSWSSGAGSKGAKFGGMQDVHFLLWKTDSRGGGSGSRCLGGGEAGDGALSHCPSGAGKKGGGPSSGTNRGYRDRRFPIPGVQSRSARNLSSAVFSS